MRADHRLQHREFIAEVYSIADIASYPWIVPHARQRMMLEDFPHLRR
jgi:GST-like protein